ncbi:MAG: zinc-binding dehydrogenase [SAR86 cluster bacterium]|nr:zinc-binding dehydrogenase [SAR86 cluster bacterium]
MNEGISIQIRSEVTNEGKLKLSLIEEKKPTPKENEVLIRVEATPINPSDLGLLLGPADVNSLKVEGHKENIVAVIDIPEPLMRMVQPRLGKSLPVGNEGAGVIEDAGENAKDLIGKVVGVAGGAMYSQYRCVPASSCLIMNEGTSPSEAASCFVNPLTTLGMVETMKSEGHKGLVHTAAASNLGQMLVKVCKMDGVPLVNIVRTADQEDKLRSLGAEFVCNSSNEDFMTSLVEALVASESTLAFDAIGGGKLSGQVLTAMEIAANKNSAEHSIYGSTTYKQVYIYGGLDRSPTTLNRAYGMSWGIGGWLLTPFIGKIGPEKFQALRKRVSDEIKTTFVSNYSKEISLQEALHEESILDYSKQATGKKYLITPHKE